MIVAKASTIPDWFVVHHAVADNPHSIYPIPDALAVSLFIRGLGKDMSDECGAVGAPQWLLEWTVEHTVPESQMKFGNNSIWV